MLEIVGVIIIIVRNSVKYRVRIMVRDGVSVKCRGRGLLNYKLQLN